MFGGVDYEAWADTMNTNVFGVLRATEAVVPSLQAHRCNPPFLVLSNHSDLL